MSSGISEDLIREQAYLVARGVRALAVLGHCEPTQEAMSAVARMIARLAVPGALPFVIDRADGQADYGYAAQPWVIELYCWAQSPTVPAEQRRRIIGLLLGYSPNAMD
jgi:hypothetical protein